MVVTYILKFIAFYICFLFSAGFFAGAAKACFEEKWTDFGHNFMLALIYVGGLMWIVDII